MKVPPNWYGLSVQIDFGWRNFGAVSGLCGCHSLRGEGMQIFFNQMFCPKETHNDTHTLCVFKGSAELVGKNNKTNIKI